MSNPTISFRLSTYQIARGLQIIRNLEPNYHATSISNIIKVLYLDYLAKMSINKQDTVPQHLIDEVESIIYQSRTANCSINSLSKLINEVSIKSSVEDFSPPKDWENN